MYLHVALRRCVDAQVEQFVQQLSVARLTVDSMLQQQFVQVYGARMVRVRLTQRFPLLRRSSTQLGPSLAGTEAG